MPWMDTFTGEREKKTPVVLVVRGESRIYLKLYITSCETKPRSKRVERSVMTWTERKGSFRLVRGTSGRTQRSATEIRGISSPSPPIIFINNNIGIGIVHTTCCFCADTWENLACEKFLKTGSSTAWRTDREREREKRISLTLTRL